jgi:hypothetical protein
LGVFQEEHVLSDLQFPVGIAGIVVIIEKDNVERAKKKMEQELFSDIERRILEWYLEWVHKQQIPFVIAGAGYQTVQFSADEFRKQFGIEPSIPIIAGPPRSKRKRTFDTRFTKRVIKVLVEYISDFS